jgi:uncharacterized protein involved in exopolysaccharide biosynthesis
MRILALPMKVAVPVALAVAALSLALPDQYTSDVRLLPKDPRNASNPLGGAAAASILGIADGDSGEAYVDILNSWRVAEGIVSTTYHFTDQTWKFGAQREHQESLISYLDLPKLDQAIKALPKLLDVNRDPKSGLITISATTPSPQLSQQIVQTATRLLQHFILYNSQTQAGAKAEFASSRLVEAEAEALQAEAGMKAFLMQNRDFLSSSDPGVRLKGGRLDAELQLRRQMVANLANSREQALLDSKDSTPILNVLDPGQLPLEKTKPARGGIILAAFGLALAGTLAWQHRAWLHHQMLANP